MFRNDSFNTLNIKVALFVFLLMKKFTLFFEFNLTIQNYGYRLERLNMARKIKNKNLKARNLKIMNEYDFLLY